MGRTKTFRIFVSSTLGDFKEERNALQERVFPRLRELCLQYGGRFQAIDLRCEVSEEVPLAEFEPLIDARRLLDAWVVAALHLTRRLLENKRQMITWVQS